MNIWFAFFGILAGVLAGAAAGLRFSDDNWLGGYSSWPRRMTRLGHISFFGIAFLNLAFAFFTQHSPPSPILTTGSIALASAQLLMPAVCYLSAFHKPARHLFALPVACVLVGWLCAFIGRIQ